MERNENGLFVNTRGGTPSATPSTHREGCGSGSGTTAPQREGFGNGTTVSPREGCGRNSGIATPIQREGCAMGACGCNSGEGRQLAMVYAPMQCFRILYSHSDALMRGTLFEELDKPLEEGI